MHSAQIEGARCQQCTPFHACQAGTGPWMQPHTDMGCCSTSTSATRTGAPTTSWRGCATAAGTSARWPTWSPTTSALWATRPWVSLGLCSMVRDLLECWGQVQPQQRGLLSPLLAPDRSVIVCARDCQVRARLRQSACLQLADPEPGHGLCMGLVSPLLVQSNFAGRIAAAAAACWATKVLLDTPLPASVSSSSLRC